MAVLTSLSLDFPRWFAQYSNAMVASAPISVERHSCGTAKLIEAFNYQILPCWRCRRVFLGRLEYWRYVCGLNLRNARGKCTIVETSAAGEHNRRRLLCAHAQTQILQDRAKKRRSVLLGLSSKLLVFQRAPMTCIVTSATWTLSRQFALCRQLP